jgi:hypothetical protein
MTSLAVRPTTTAERVEQGSPFGFVGDGARHPLAERPAVRCEGHPGTRGDEFVDPIGWQLDDQVAGAALDAGEEVAVHSQAWEPHHRAAGDRRLG